MNLLTPRKATGFDRFDALVLAAYVAVLAFAIHHYLPFADEAQEWLIARDSSLPEMLFRRLHYEGHPALWSLILWVAARLHMPYAGINWMAGVFALPGIYLLLRFSPFPRIFRWLLPFTFFLQYQYAVVARPYVFVPALLFGMCMVFTMQRPRPVLFGLLAGLLANISVHAGIVAAVFCLLYLDQLRRMRKRSQLVAARKVAAGAAIFFVLSVCSALSALPAPDAMVASDQTKTVMKPNALLGRMFSVERLPASAPPLDAAFDYAAAVNGSNPQADAHAAAYPWIVRMTVITAVLGANAACYPIATSNALAVAFLAAFWLWLWARGCPRLVLPFLVSTLLSVHIFVYDHHTGIFLLALMAAAWIALREPGSEETMHVRLRWIQPTLCVLTLGVAALQVGWSWHCIRGDVYAMSDPGRETEEFLARGFAGKRVAGFIFDSVSTQAWAPDSIFFNQPHAYWVWSLNVFTDRRRTEALEQHPDAVVVGDVINGPGTVSNQWIPIIPVGSRPYLQMLDYWLQHGYRETHRFCGEQFRRMSTSYTFCEVILEPAANASGAAAIQAR